MAATRTAARQGSDRRAAIIDAALNRFLAQGLSATSLRQIQRDAHVSNGSLFHHFPSKEALAGAVYVDCVTRYQQAFLAELGRHEDAQQAVRAIVGMHLRWCVDHPEMARFLITMTEPAVLGAAAAELMSLNERFAVALHEWWRPHAHYGTLRSLSPAHSQALWLGPAQELVRAWLLGVISDPPGRGDAQVLADAAWLSLRAGLTT
ncbi:TetR/AcrR family transcriptional regulator [Mycobacterium szulgai]|uniref:TetR family transcriptional regulator n=1 Tax=Mycobacterium szulgai TaxID=1787 RepID=A0A1X2DXC1_MYCSZ|nr:TetR/AcrR family transcriptional regulator [Mycobacterium szulgai]MCV7075252.1 TetR/AcrR family transcriptional regulator [Mycobacterium szulgai]ORW92781.1 TetR family transcriptional regulator [Mycobacterium szulgai]